MAVAKTDVKVYLTGAVADGGAQADPDLSLGGFRSSTVINPVTLIDDVDGITDADATITVDATADFDATGYIWIDAEAIKYAGKTGVTFTGCTRAQFGTAATAHDDNAMVRQFAALFDAISGSEAAAGDSEYRCVCFKNEHGANSCLTAKAYSKLDTGNGEDDISFAVEVPAGGDTDGSVQTVATESTAPSVGAGNVSAWSDATTYATGIGVNQGAHDENLDTGEIVMVWIRRVVSVGAGAAADEHSHVTLGFDTV